MKYFISFMTLLMISVSALYCQGSDHLVTGEAAARLLERIKTNQAGIQTISGSFTEQRTISTMPMPLLFTGKVYAQPPGFLFLSYEQPVQHIMKVSGDTVLFYVADNMTADQVDLKAVGEGGAPPNLFGWDPSDFKGEILETDEGYILYNPEIKAGDREIRITLDKETLMVQALTMLEPGGDITKIVMDDLQVNAEIPESILDFQLPKGVTINQMGQ